MPETLPSSETEEQFFVPDPIRWQSRIPALRLLRAFRMAIDYRRMVLALVAVLLWGGGLVWILGVPPENAPEDPAPTTIASVSSTALWPWEEESLVRIPKFHRETATTAPLDQFGRSYGREERLSPNDTLGFHEPVRHRNDEIALMSIQEAFSNPSAILWPVRKLLQPASDILSSHQAMSVRLQGTLAVLWGLLICGLFGGAISRMAAIDFAGAGDPSPFAGIRFSSRHLVSYLGAPLIPVVGLLACWIPNFFAGIVGRIPWIGDTLVAVLWVIPFILGTLMMLIIVGVAASWPLMISAISTEASDAFDGLSRAYSYLFNRLWYLIVLVLLACLAGSAGLYLVNGLLSLSVGLTTLSVMAGDAGRVSLPFEAGFSTGTLPLDQSISPPAAWGLTFWARTIASIPVAFVFSYFWTASTIVYFLLRHREDATPLTEVAAFPSQPLTDLPLVGIPAAERRESAEHAEPATPVPPENPDHHKNN